MDSLCNELHTLHAFSEGGMTVSGLLNYSKVNKQASKM